MRRFLALAISIAVGGFDLVCGLLRWCAGRPARCRGVVLYYHAIKANERARFARQMDRLTTSGMPFQASFPESMRAGRKNVAVTFDDGFRSVVENAVPELAKRAIPYTFFVPSGCLGHRPSWVHEPTHPAWDECVVTAGELARLRDDPLATIGSHSVTHPNFLELNSASAQDELRQSREVLRKASGVDVDLFSFPHGARSKEHLEQARSAGYRRVFTIEPFFIGADPDAFVLGRVAASPHDWPLEFRLKIAGAYRWRAHFHRLKERANW